MQANALEQDYRVYKMPLCILGYIFTFSIRKNKLIEDIQIKVTLWIANVTTTLVFGLSSSV